MKPKPWMVIYIDKSYIDGIEKWENMYGIEIVIPTVTVWKGKVRGKNKYDEVPFLFNFGFMRVKPDSRYDIDYLIKLKREVPVIAGYLKDTTKPDEGFNYAMVSSKEVNAVLSASDEASIFGDDIDKVLKVGDSIQLIGYPFSGIYGNIKKINKSNETVTISAAIGDNQTDIIVPFYNVYYTMYHYEEDGKDYKEQSIEDINPLKLNKVYARISLELEDEN